MDDALAALAAQYTHQQDVDTQPDQLDLDFLANHGAELGLDPDFAASLALAQPSSQPDIQLPTAQLPHQDHSTLLGSTADPSPSSSAGAATLPHFTTTTAAASSSSTPSEHLHASPSESPQLHPTLDGLDAPPLAQSDSLAGAIRAKKTKTPEQAALRKERNRVAAQRSRDKKAAAANKLEGELEALREENRRLKEKADEADRLRVQVRELERVIQEVKGVIPGMLGGQAQMQMQQGGLGFRPP
ncbi:hypothetical protein JCM8097_008369 [Rhodosporidiobolus ruineniae]